MYLISLKIVWQRSQNQHLSLGFFSKILFSRIHNHHISQHALLLFLIMHLNLTKLTCFPIHSNPRLTRYSKFNYIIFIAFKISIKQSYHYFQTCLFQYNKALGANKYDEYDKSTT